MESISFSELKNISEESKPIVWVLCPYYDNEIIGNCTGFCVHKDGLIMTCAHGMDQTKYPGMTFKARRLDENGFIHTAKIVSQYINWDITLLQLEKVVDCKPGTFATGSLDEGETVVLIGHPRSLVGSLLVGYSVYRCVADVTLPTGNLRCSQYDSTASTTTPEYRVMGHYLNKVAGIRRLESGSSSAWNLHPLIPVIQIKGLRSEEGCSGAPVFNVQGHIVGMHVHAFAGYNASIHVSLLREVLRIALSDVDPRGRKHSGGEHCDFEGGLKKRLKINEVI